MKYICLCVILLCGTSLVSGGHTGTGRSKLGHLSHLMREDIRHLPTGLTENAAVRVARSVAPSLGLPWMVKIKNRVSHQMVCKGTLVTMVDAPIVYIATSEFCVTGKTSADFEVELANGIVAPADTIFNLNGQLSGAPFEFDISIISITVQDTNGIAPMSFPPVGSTRDMTHCSIVGEDGRILKVDPCPSMQNQGTTMCMVADTTTLGDCQNSLQNNWVTGSSLFCTDTGGMYLAGILNGVFDDNRTFILSDTQKF